MLWARVCPQAPKTCCLIAVSCPAPPWTWSPACWTSGSTLPPTEASCLGWPRPSLLVLSSARSVQNDCVDFLGAFRAGNTFLYDIYTHAVFDIMSCPAAGHRMWALQRLRKLLTTEYGQSININRLLGDSEGEARSMVSQQLNFIVH